MFQLCITGQTGWRIKEIRKSKKGAHSVLATLLSVGSMRHKCGLPANHDIFLGELNANVFRKGAGTSSKY